MELLSVIRRWAFRDRLFQFDWSEDWAIIGGERTKLQAAHSKLCYSRAFEAMTAALPPRAACRTMVDLLALAHDRACEAALAERLTAELDAGRLPDMPMLRKLFAPDSADCQRSSSPLRRSASTTSSRPSPSEPTLAEPPFAEVGHEGGRPDRCRAPHPGAERPAAARHQEHLARLAARADTEGWPAARFLAALTEHELAERARGRIQRHLEEARLRSARRSTASTSTPGR